MTTEEKIEAFTNELKELCKKYGVTVYKPWEGSDWFEIDGKMVAADLEDFLPEKENINL